MPNLAKSIAEHDGRGYVLAPAGFGKTYLIAESLKHAEDRQLVLTHIYAGVNAIQEKLRALNVPRSSFRIDTIASWALRMCLSYPENADWRNDAPEGNDWRKLYGHCTKFLEAEFIRRVISVSYASVYVDEYQDCSVSQHKLILKLAEILPVRVFGDPLQGIFGFSGEDLVEWDTHVAPHFELLGQLDTPWRWKNAGATDLGDWLREVRGKLEARQAIDLSSAPATGAKVRICNSSDELRNKQITTCKYFNLAGDERVAAIHKGDNQHKAMCQKLAKNTGGRFSSIEEIEGKRLHKFISDYGRQNSPGEKLLCAIEFARTKCMSKVNDALSAATKRGESVQLRDNTKNPELVVAANNFLAVPTPRRLAEFLTALKFAPETQIYARDLLNRLFQVLRNCSDNTDDCLCESASDFQRQFRHRGRPVRYPRLLGTTLLLKGLEFDHAIVLDAGSLSRKDLYVALTRGSKSLTVLSTSTVVNPDS